MTRPKIIFSLYDDIHNPYYGGGGARSVHEVARGLSDEFDIEVVNAAYLGARDEVIDGVAYRRISWPAAGPRLGQLLFQAILPWYVRRLDHDLWVESLTPPFSTTCLQLYTRKPVIGLVHMLAAADMERKYKLPFHLIEDIGLKTYRSFISPSESVVHKLRSLKHQPVTHLIPNGIDVPPESALSRTGGRNVVYLGRIEVNQKGLDLLVEAFKQLAGQTSANLVIAGAGLERDMAALRRLVQSAGLSDRVRLLGLVAGDAKAELLRNAGVVVMPSRFETFGVVALEAMAYGKPVVCFDIPGVSWLPAGGALKARPFESADLAACIKQALKPEQAAQMGRAARLAAQRYAWPEIIRQYREVFRAALKRGEQV